MSNGFIMTENPFFKQDIDMLCIICHCTFKMDQTPHSIFDKLEKTQSQMNVYNALESISNFKEIKIQKQTEKVCEVCYITISTIIRFCEMCNKSASFLKSYIHYKEMKNISQSHIIKPESIIDRPMSNTTGTNVLGLKQEVLNDSEEQDVNMQVWPKVTTITTVDTLSSTTETTMIEKEEKGTTMIEICAEEFCTNEKMLSDEVEQDWKLDIWPESPTITMGNVINSTSAMFIKEEMIIQEKEITTIETSTEELCAKQKMLDDEIEQDVKMEIWPKLTTITTVDTLNHTTETPLFEKEETVIQEMRNSSEIEMTNNETCLERQTLRKRVTLINTDKALGKESQEEIIDNGVLKVKCNVCDRFYSKGYMPKHLRMHSVERPYSCEICGKTFKHASTKWSHKEIHNDQHECKVCGMKFTTPRYLKDHLIVHSDERSFECEKCEKCFPSKQNLRQHMLNHLEEKRHECNVCGKKFKKPVNLKEHLSVQDFKWQISIRNHMKKHKKHRPHACSICGKTFVYASNLKEHFSVHASDRPFACEQCGKCFSLLKYLKQHMISHAEEKTHECRVCGVHLRYERTLRLHLSKHHKERTN